jgi:hypothetical protein
LTSQPERVPDATPASKITGPLRGQAALVLVGANALLLLVGLINLLIPAGEHDSFASRAGRVFFDFVGVTGIALPLLAVLLATYVQPPVHRARLITQVALVEYAVSAFLGAIALLGWLIGGLADAAFRNAFTGLLVRGAYLAIFVIGVFLVFKIWRTLYHVPKPKPQPSAYGPNPAGYPQPYGQQQPGYPAGFPPGTGQPTGYGQPTTYGQPAGYGQPGYGQATYPVPGHPPAPASAPAVPQSAPPVPQSAPPTATAPAQSDAEPTQVIPPAWDGASERTQVISQPADGSAERTQVIVRGVDDAGERTQLINPASQQPSAGSRPPAVDLGDEPTEPHQR